jgi:hypothetical protein
MLLDISVTSLLVRYIVAHCYYGSGVELATSAAHRIGVELVRSTVPRCITNIECSVGKGAPLGSLSEAVRITHDALS